MDNQLWSWLLTIVGVTGFILAGRKVWWAWYVNLACQILWFAYAIVTAQYGFIAAAMVYSVVFTQNAVKWTRERHQQDIDKTQAILDQWDADKDAHRMRFYREVKAAQHRNRTIWEEDIDGGIRE